MGSDHLGSSQVVSSDLPVMATDRQNDASARRGLLDASEVILTEFRPDLFKYWRDQVVFICATGTIAFVLLQNLDNRFALIAFICVVVFGGVKAVSRGKTVAALEWYLTNQRVLSSDGQAIPLLAIKSARSWHNVNVVSVDGDVLRLVYLAGPATAASKIRAAASAMRTAV